MCLQIKWFNIGMTRFVVPWYPILTWATAGNYICRRMLCAFWFRKGLVLLCSIDTLEMASETQVLCCLIPTDANFLKSMPCFRFSVPVGGSEEEALDSQRWGHDMLRDSFRNWCHFGPQFHTVPHSSTQFHIPTWRCSSLVTCDGSFQNPEPWPWDRNHPLAVDQSWILLLSACLLCEKLW